MRYIYACMITLAFFALAGHASTAHSIEAIEDFDRPTGDVTTDNRTQPTVKKPKGVGITGTTAAELASQVITLSKNDGLKLTWDIKWRYITQITANMCYIFKIYTSAVLHEPPQRLIWLDEELASDELRAKWQRFHTAFTNHNKGHADIARRAAAAVRKTLGTMKAKDCEQLKKDTDAKAYEIIPWYRLEDDEYDRITGNDEIHTGADLEMVR
ncbi:MAG: hypothetical protein A3J24_06765 [Deltaproteobacteria bacterium RIFCSPLOWO2_02_FULL_53_8]|nr:MAG: hypothetical protein A3J24_06765 [Deltaproteobacteria bacterium RIFCSPLOWO2_02_FULL_53_8]